MVYKNCETYLNEEVRRPIKNALKDVDENVRKEVMQAVDYLCEKYRELNCFSNFCESKFKDMSFQEYMDYKKEHFKYVDYDKLECPFTDEELEERKG